MRRFRLPRRGSDRQDLRPEKRFPGRRRTHWGRRPDDSHGGGAGACGLPHGILQLGRLRRHDVRQRRPMHRGLRRLPGAEAVCREQLRVRGAGRTALRRNHFPADPPLHRKAQDDRRIRAAPGARRLVPEHRHAAFRDFRGMWRQRARDCAMHRNSPPRERTSILSRPPATAASRYALSRKGSRPRPWPAARESPPPQ